MKWCIITAIRHLTTKNSPWGQAWSIDSAVCGVDLSRANIATHRPRSQAAARHPQATQAALGGFMWVAQETRPGAPAPKPGWLVQDHVVACRRWHPRPPRERYSCGHAAALALSECKGSRAWLPPAASISQAAHGFLAEGTGDNQESALHLALLIRGLVGLRAHAPWNRPCRIPGGPEPGTARLSALRPLLTLQAGALCPSAQELLPRLKQAWRMDGGKAAAGQMGPVPFSRPPGHPGHPCHPQGTLDTRELHQVLTSAEEIGDSSEQDLVPALQAARTLGSAVPPEGPRPILSPPRWPAFKAESLGL